MSEEPSDKEMGWIETIYGDYLGTGMHGGTIYIRGNVDLDRCGKEVGTKKLNKKDKKILEELLKEFSKDFSIDYNEIMLKEFVKLYPKTNRPYGNLYAK